VQSRADFDTILQTTWLGKAAKNFRGEAFLNTIPYQKNADFDLGKGLALNRVLLGE